MKILLKMASWQGHESDLEVNETLRGNKQTTNPHPFDMDTC